MQNVFNKYMTEIKDFPLLTDLEEVELGRLVRNGDEKALHRLVNSNLRLVVSAARRYSPRNIMEFMDIVQEGNEGLVMAAKRYDPDRGMRFSTYAGWWIKQNISKAVARDRPIRIPEHIDVGIRNIVKAETESRALYCREPTDEEVMAQANLSRAKLDDYRNLDFHDTVPSLDSKVAEDTELRGFVGYSCDRAERNIAHEDVRGVVGALSAVQNEVVRRRFGFGCLPEILQSIADDFGCGRENIRYHQNNALAAMREHPKQLIDYYIAFAT